MAGRPRTRRPRRPEPVGGAVDITADIAKLAGIERQPGPALCSKPAEPHDIRIERARALASSAADLAVTEAELMAADLCRHAADRITHREPGPWAADEDDADLHTADAALQIVRVLAVAELQVTARTGSAAVPRRYMGNDWRLAWWSPEPGDYRRPWIRVVARLSASGPDVRPEALTWGDRPGDLPRPEAGESLRRQSVADQAWQILADCPELPFAAMQSALAEIDLALIPVAGGCRCLSAGTFPPLPEGSP